jgi:hypothetical protein
MDASPTVDPEPFPKAAASRQIVLSAIALAAILLTQISWMARTNFSGFDEWLMIHLVSKGIGDIPYANRPFELLWLLPVNLAPCSLTPYVVLHAAYSLLCGCLVFLLCRRLIPGRPRLWLSTAMFSIVWGPGDLARLSTLERAAYASITFGMLLAIELLVESWRLRAPILLGAAMLVAFLAARSYEAVVPLLLCAPLLLARIRSPSDSRIRPWAGAWLGVMLLAVALFVRPWFSPGGPLVYQLGVLGLDLDPGRVAQRLLSQYAFHLAPLVLSPPSELLVPAVPVAVAVFAAIGLVWTRFVGGEADGPADRRVHVQSMTAGLLWAGLGYGALVLTPARPTALRMQFLSAPGIGLFLASGASLVATFLPARWARPAIGLIGAWIIAVGTGRTLAMQRAWDTVSAYPAQMRMLSGLTREVPDVKPHTLVVLLDHGKAWRATYGFRHALSYLYQGRAIGYVHGAWDALYPTSFAREGIRVEPWPVVRAAWGTGVTLHRYDETIVVRSSQGGVRVLEEWPQDLPALPTGAAYDPRSRIVAGAAPPPERAILPPSP